VLGLPANPLWRRSIGVIAFFVHGLCGARLREDAPPQENDAIDVVDRRKGYVDKGKAINFHGTSGVWEG
jgi:hypothetical protein